ncbi:MAG: hypothetical protein HKN26_10750, partial [Acidimicrobiales bacterium]|nr:hypothetical protein [Acidimicrobiales bacterium]
MSVQAVVLGVGAVGSRAARQLVSTDLITRTFVADADNRQARAVAESLGPGATAVDYEVGAPPPPGDIVVLAGPAGSHATA